MIISRTPFRISLFGGGTDYPAWYTQYGGITVGAAIDKYCWITLRRLPPFFDYRHRIVYSEIELVREIHSIRHPAARECLRIMPPHHGVSVHHEGDLPARSGLGSSSSFTVGLLNALRALRGHTASCGALAEQAIHIEREVLGENVGSQDQVWAAYGGIRRIEFNPNGSFETRPLAMARERRQNLNSSLLLFFTGLSRFASEIAGKQVANFDKKHSHLVEMQRLAEEAADILEGDCPLDTLGEMMNESWMLKRSLAEGVSTPEIDAAYEAGIEAGALGGKLLGAGGGGFLLFYVPPERQNAVRERLGKLVNVEFRLGAEGSRIVLYDDAL